MKPLLYLNYRKLMNYISMTMRSPKRLIVAIPFVLYLVMMVFVLTIHHTARHTPFIDMYTNQEVWAFAFLIFALAMTGFLLRSFNDSLLVFPLSDIDFIFGTPLHRFMIMGFKLINLYAKAGAFLLLYVLMMLPTLKMIVQNVHPASLLIVLATVVMFTAVVINIGTLINLITTYRKEEKWWLSWIVKGTASALLAYGAVSIAVGYKQTGDFVGSMVSTLMKPVFIILLCPAKWAADLTINPIIGWHPIFAVEFVLLAACAFCSFCLVLSRDENPYEPSLSISARAALTRAGTRSAGLAWLTMEAMKNSKKAKSVKGLVPPFGSGVWAILWKNMTVGLRTWHRNYVIVLAAFSAFLVVFRFLANGSLDPRMTDAIILMGGFYLIIGTSTASFLTLRADVRQANILKPMPIDSWKIVAITALQSPLAVLFIAIPVSVIFSSLYSLPARNSLSMVMWTLPFISYSVPCAQSLVAVLYSNAEDSLQQFISVLMSQLATFVTLMPSVGMGLILWYFRVAVWINALVVIMISLIVSAVGIALGEYAYRKHDPTSE